MTVQQDTGPSLGRAVAVYTALRGVAFGGTYGLMLVLGMSNFGALFVALVVSSLVALVLLRPQREAVAVALAARSERKRVERERLRSLLDE